VKNILVIGSKRVDASKNEPLEMIADYVQRTVDAASIEVSYCHLDELVHVLDGSNTRIYLAVSGQALESFDFVWFRGKLAPSLNELGIITRYLDTKHVKYANHSYADRAPFGKLAQMYTLAALGLPYPKTVSALAEYLPGAIADEFTYPVVLKAVHAGHGHSNYLVRDEAHLRELLAAEPETTFVAQTYIPNDGDYRVLLIGNEPLIIHRKGSEDSHLNNTSQGGTATLTEVTGFPAEILEQARRFAAACNYQIAGVDVMFGSRDDKPYFLEANSQPQLMTGAFTDEKAAILRDFLHAQLDG
jgi:glutathione synthase/RimK-type ligase-like ATP-grasp enzyme